MDENTEINDDTLLSESEVWDIVKFAREFASFGYYGNGGMLNPDVVSQRMRDVTLNPLQAETDTLAKAMKSPKESEEALQGFSQDFELQSMVYKRLITYLSNMLSFDVTYTANVSKKEDYGTPKYRKDLTTVETFLDNFNYKKEFRVVVREMLRNDTYFGCIREIGESTVLQELPASYCKITGRWEHGFLFSFNMFWFLQPGVDISMYPSFFKKKAKEIWGNGTINKQGYNPSLPPEFRDKSSWMYWVDVPVNVGVCFKLSPELASRVPYFTPLFNDLILQSSMRNLQKNMNMAAASKLLIGEVPYLSKETKATVKDSLAISPELLGKFLSLVKNALSETVKVASVPLSNLQGISFETDNEMYDKYLRTALASSGVNTNLIFSSDIKPNAIETQLSLNVDEQMMTVIYEQFNEFMNYIVNKKTRTYTFYFEFEGTEFFLNRTDRHDKAMGLLKEGIVIPQKIAASLGMKPATFRRHMEEASSNGFIESLTPPAFMQQKEMAEIQIDAAKEQNDANIEAGKQNTEATLKAKSQSESLKTESGEKGRPKKKVSELGEEGANTRESGGNIGRGGKI